MYTLFTEANMKERIEALALSIEQAYASKVGQLNNPLVVLAVLKGSFMFASDLVKRLNLPCKLEFIRLASYGDGTTSSGKVRPVDLSLPSLEGADVLVVEDIVDTGLTMKFLLNYLKDLHQPASIAIATLLDKPEARLPETVQVVPDWAGFNIGKQFVVGYGLDYAGLYRNLPYIAVLEDSDLQLQNQPSQAAKPHDTSDKIEASAEKGFSRMQ
jgi:hypoxanthine phosphoribosyltransferase